MDEAEFDKFADEYREIHRNNVRMSGEEPDFFTEYKIREVFNLCSEMSGLKSPQVLDFGVGTGVSVPYFKQFFPNSNITCLDVPDTLLRKSRTERI